jgi:hypothetical protein
MTGLQKILGVAGLVTLGAVGGILITGDGTFEAEAATKVETLNTATGEVNIQIRVLPDGTCWMAGSATLPVLGDFITKTVSPFQPVKASLRNGCAAVADLISRRAFAGHFTGVDAGE